MGNTRKQIAFDLNTNALKIYYPTESWNNAYEVIRKHMTENGFRWLQGSVYVSEKPIKPYRVIRILDDLIKKNPWLNVCMRDCRETNIGKEHDINNLFDKNMKVPTREEIQERKQGNMADYLSEIKKMKESSENAIYKNKINKTRER